MPDISPATSFLSIPRSGVGRNEKGEATATHHKMRQLFTLALTRLFDDHLFIQVIILETFVIAPEKRLMWPWSFMS
jgi:hypothetical protein